jgi:hypothetical protein
MAGVLLRVLPTGMYVGRARVLVERALVVNRRAWLTIVSGFCEPLFYLFAMGIGFGALVGDVVGQGGRTVSYVEFVAPALLAASAMNGASSSSSSTPSSTTRCWRPRSARSTWPSVRSRGHCCVVGCTRPASSP